VLVMMYFKGYSSTWTSSLPLSFFCWKNPNNICTNILNSSLSTMMTRHFFQLFIILLYISTWIKTFYICRFEIMMISYYLVTCGTCKSSSSPLLTTILIIIIYMRDMRNVNILLWVSFTEMIDFFSLLGSVECEIKVDFWMENV